MTQEELDKILDLHKLWLINHTKGKRADLSGADLRKADFSDADLGGANFTNANLSGANLSGAYLNGVDLNGVDLTTIRDYEITRVWIGWKLLLVKELVIRQKMIETNDKNLAILYKNSWMANACKKILKGNT